MQRFVCNCGNILFFDNFKCLRCGNEVGYDCKGGTMVVIQSAGGMRRCGNGIKHGACNWVVPAQKGEYLCPACTLNRTIPDLSAPRNLLLWGRMETAKRRLVYTLLRLGFTLPTLKENAQAGLAFDIVSSFANPEATMGHLNGVITVNLEEADDTYRQINRQQLNESSRTLLGHFRHETGHYVWQRWVGPLMWNDPLRNALRHRFGDERADYNTALAAHYKNGAQSGWEQGHISAYATSHPWEDWAETWAHYLQIIDGLETCEGLGLNAESSALKVAPFPAQAGVLPPMLPPSPAADAEFLTWLQRWVCLATMLNEISASLGQPLLYPFVLSVGVAQKLRLVHHLVKLWGGK